MNSRIKKLTEAFYQLFGNEGNQIRYFLGPGRVNLIGEHIDYCGGFVFPAALTLDNIVAIRPIKERKLKLAATDLEGIYEVDLDNIDAAKALKWGNYQAGVAKELIALGYDLSGAEMLFNGTIPFGSGLSSSASIELATAIALSALSYEKSSKSKKTNLVELAVASQKAENNFCNVNCGIMDQFASAMGKEDNAILLNCNTLEYKYVPLILDGYKLVIANTCKKRALAESKYNERRSEVDLGLEILNKFMPNKKFLCDVTVQEFEQYKNEIENEVIRKRVQHVVYENYRVVESVNVLESGDLIGFGKIMKQANDSIRYLYEATGFELDTMVDEAEKIEGCIAARMTGAGFGGCTVNIVKDEAVDSFIENVGKNYKEKTGLTPNFYICEIGDGARELKLN